MKTHKQMQDRLNWYIGKQIDFDGVYQNQCMDLAVDYMWWATEGKYRMKGNAIDAINSMNSYGKYATIHKNTKDFLPKVGDIAVWTKAPAHPTYGHIGIVYDDINLNTCTMLDQNWDGDPSKPAKLRTDNYRGVTHFIRINFGKGSEETTGAKTHKVKPKETLYSIAKQHNLSVDELKKINNLKSNVININQVLKLKKGANKPATPKPDKDVNTTVYTVKKGNTLYSIAKLYGVTVDEIKDVNGMKDNTIKPKQKLKVPVKKVNKPVSKPAIKKFNPKVNRGRSTSEYASAIIDSLGAEVRERHGSQSKGFNFDTKAGYSLKPNELVYIFESYSGWLRIYSGDLSNNEWVWHERVKIKDTFK